MRSPRRRAALAALGMALAVAAGCLADARGGAFAQDDAKLKEMYRRPDTIPFPADNPYSDAKAKLGEMLFFDPRMSGDKNISCATCHTPSLAWSDPLKVSIGAGNQPMSKRSQTLLNLAWAELLMWDGRFPSLEDQVLGPLFKSDIMGNSKTGMVEEINAIPAYRGLFEQAFPGGAVSVEAVAKALATYERTIVSNKAPFDRWIENDENALDAAAKRGFALFNGKANCAACHNTWRFTDDGFHDIGLADQDPGRGKQVPDVPVLMHAFKTPTLRNVAQRPPYMHDGTIDGLEAVVRHYAQGFVTRPSLSPEMKKLDLTARDIQDLVAFMRSLTSDDDPVTIPVLPAKEAM